MTITSPNRHPPASDRGIDLALDLDPLHTFHTQPSAMPGTHDRLQLLFDNPHQVRFIGSDPVRWNPKSAVPSSSFFPSNPPSDRRFPSTARKSSNSSTSTRSSASTAPSTRPSRTYSNSDADSSSSVSTAPPEDQIPWDLANPFIMGTYDPGYDLPCEFSFLGCHVRYAPESYQDWISHNASHFTGHLPPPRLICTFCDTEFDSSRSHGDRMANYKRRLVHIGEHFWDRRSLDINVPPAHHIRPDYHLMDYMRQVNLIDEADYKYLTQHSERPQCGNTHPLGYVPTEVQARRAREDRRPHDQAREDRQRRKEKGRSTHHHTH